MCANHDETYFERGESGDDGREPFEDGDDDAIVVDQIGFLHEQDVADVRHLEPHLQEKPRFVPQTVEVVVQRRHVTCPSIKSIPVKVINKQVTVRIPSAVLSRMGRDMIFLVRFCTDWNHLWCSLSSVAFRYLASSMYCSLIWI